MSTDTSERVFRQKPAIRLGTRALFLVMLVIAIWLTFEVFRGDNSDRTFEMCYYAWVFALVSGLACLPFLDSVIVDPESITYRALFRRRTINFRDVTHLDVNASRQWIEVSDDKSVISCSRDFTHIDELIELLEARVAPHLKALGAVATSPSNTTVTEFPYPKLRWWILMIGSLAGAAIFSVLVGSCIQEMWAGDWSGERDDVLGFVVAIVFTLTGLCIAIFTFLDRDTMVALDNDALTCIRWGKITRIFYEDLERIERRSRWASNDEIVIVYDCQELELPDDVERYDELVERLDAIVPITQIDDHTVHFPVTVRSRFWWLGPVILGLFALIFLTSAVYLVAATDGGYDPRSVLGRLLPPLAFLGFGAWFMAICIRMVVQCPKHGRFDEDRIMLVLPTRRREYAPDQVDSVHLRVANSGRTGHRLDLRIAGKNYRFYGGYTSVPLVPLYKLLCKTYWPEGYRDPEGCVIAERTTSDSKE